MQTHLALGFKEEHSSHPQSFSGLMIQLLFADANAMLDPAIQVSEGPKNPSMKIVLEAAIK